VERIKHILPQYGEFDGMHSTEKCNIYWDTHVNHPCTTWTRESVSNYKWLVEHFIALCQEFTFRYPGKHHKSEELIEFFRTTIPKIETLELTPFAQAMPIELRSDNAVESYRAYYKRDKAYVYNYGDKRQEPDWWQQN
jgi:hypothetical protein